MEDGEPDEVSSGGCEGQPWGPVGVATTIENNNNSQFAHIEPTGKVSTWYGFGRQEEVFYRVSGDSLTFCGAARVAGALERLFPGGRAAQQAAAAREDPEAEPAPVGEPREGMSAAMESLAAQARAHYQRALQAQRDGNWALYGEEIRKLGDVLAKMRR